MVAATNQDLERAIGTRQFRQDLYYRLSVFPFRIPPLRERREDIPELARYFAMHFSSRLRKKVADVTPAAFIGCSHTNGQATFANCKTSWSER